MGMKIFMGKEIQTRGSNKRYEVLDNLDALYEELKKKYRDDLARELGVPYNSLNYIIRKYFPKEWIDNIKIRRIRKIR